MPWKKLDYVSPRAKCASHFCNNKPEWTLWSRLGAAGVPPDLANAAICTNCRDAIDRFADDFTDNFARIMEEDINGRRRTHRRT